MFLSYVDPITKIIGNWASEINLYSCILKIILSLILSAIIGYERSSKRHAAGLRTFIIVSLASTMAMIIDLSIDNKTSLMISAGTIIAVSIISANTILYSSKNQIKGLTTSVGLWGTGILGLLVGTGYYTISLIGFGVYLIVLSALPKMEIFLKNRSNHFEIHLELKNISYLKDFVTTIRELGLRVDDIESNPAYINSGLSVYTVSVSIISDELKKYKTHHEIIEALKSLEYVYHIEEM
ncbi:MAG: MgtC/SapB family protein [Coprobacillus sp.]|nr:MgtC/SapB family protein [Coprobacillus sp.]MDY4144842.1 MgtC/SapB family protein [Bacilli bacterium]